MKYILEYKEMESKEEFFLSNLIEFSVTIGTVSKDKMLFIFKFNLYDMSEGDETSSCKLTIYYNKALNILHGEILSVSASLGGKTVGYQFREWMYGVPLFQFKKFINRLLKDYKYNIQWV